MLQTKSSSRRTKSSSKARQKVAVDGQKVAVKKLYPYSPKGYRSRKEVLKIGLINLRLQIIKQEKKGIFGRDTFDLTIKTINEVDLEDCRS